MKSEFESAKKDTALLKYRQSEVTSPTSTVRRTTRAWTPNPHRDTFVASPSNNELQSKRSKSVSRYVETQNGMEPQDSRYTNRYPEPKLQRWRSDLLGTTPCHHSSSFSSPCHYITNCFAQQRCKTRHFHLPPHRLQEEQFGRSAEAGRIPPPPLRSSLHCALPCHGLSWSEVEYICKSLDSKVIHTESFIEQLSKLIKATAIGNRLDQSAMYLKSLIDCLEASATNSCDNRNRSRRSDLPPLLFKTPNSHFILEQLTKLTTTSSSLPFPSSGEAVVSGQQICDTFERKKVAKEEVLTRQKAEKLYEELQQQQNRRHGYVPSAFPPLQRNFNRFNSLISEFERSEKKAPAPPALSPTPISFTCTALYSFKGLNSKELSFNRGDVIRIHRIIDVNWMQGEHNGQIGIFPSSYVKTDNNKVGEQIKLISLYPFSARNKNELSLKKGEILHFLRHIDANWIEGFNNHGQTGIFPKLYVAEVHEADPHEDGETFVPVRPKTLRIVTTPLRFVVVFTGYLRAKQTTINRL